MIAFNGVKIPRTNVGPFSKNCFDIAESFVQAIVVVMILFAVFFRTASVVGNSMLQTLHDDDRLYVWKYKYTPTRGDVVVITKGENIDKPIVKRAIAVGGDTVDLQFDASGYGKVLVNGEVIDEPYINERMYRMGYEVDFPQVIPEGYVFVMGDNRNHSSDSRFSEVGLINVNDIIGKVVWIIFPPYRFGAVH